jgi:hypothetical protein
MQMTLRSSLMLILMLALASVGFAQVQIAQPVQVQPAPTRIPQQIVVNGQQVNGAYVPSGNGGMQSYSCPSPQEYVTPDGASRGWACYDSATGVWLLNALPPAQPVQAVQPVPQPVVQPAVVYQAPPATIVYQAPPTVVYAEPYRTVVVPAYSPKVVIGAAVIQATGRIVAAAIHGSYRHHVVYAGPRYVYPVRGARGRRW